MVPRKFNVDDKLYAKSYRGLEKWIPMKVTMVTGPYLIKQKLNLASHYDVMWINYVTICYSSYRPTAGITDTTTGDLNIPLYRLTCKRRPAMDRYTPPP